tara:strand:- start:25551 stop:27374 length:1824 start_codon:yes stop_codon:yes gene_type:complete
MAATNKKINYFARNFSDVRTELFNFIKKYYPETFQDFNDASIGTMLVELNAAVSDMLSFNTDRMFQETQLDFAQERKSILNIARTLGLNVPGKRPSVSIVDFSVNVPVYGDTFDIRYAPVLKYGAQVLGGGQSFETLDDIDFSEPLSVGGIPNRLVLPNTNQNGTLVGYTLVKREFVVAGVTNVFRKTISNTDAIPFLEVTLPNTNVISIEQVVTLEGSNLQGNPTLSQFADPELSWYEMDSLMEDKIFIQDKTRQTDNTTITPGKWVNTNRRFIKEYTDKGFCKMTFGSGNADQEQLNTYANNNFTLRIGDFINTTAMGEIPKVGTTMYIRYRTGGGATGNVGANTLTAPGQYTLNVQGPNPQINRRVSQSLKVNNPVPAFGGADAPSTEQIKKMVRYNFSSQNRAVTLKDYVVLIDKMPGTFGIPFRNNVSERQNKIDIAVIGLDSQGKLSNSSTNTLKENIASWLADYRMINDYVLTRDGKVFDLAFDIDIFIDKAFSRGEVIAGVIDSVQKYFKVQDWDMGDNIYLSQLIENINNVGGVLNVIDFKVFNKTGSPYSSNVTTQEISDLSTLEINLTEDFTLFAEYDSMFQIRFPQTDIKVRVKE